MSFDFKKYLAEGGVEGHLNEGINKPLPDFFKPIFAKLAQAGGGVQNFDRNPSPEQLTDLRSNPKKPYALFSYNKTPAQEDLLVIYIKDSPTNKVMKELESKIPKADSWGTDNPKDEILRAGERVKNGEVLEQTFFRITQ